MRLLNILPRKNKPLESYADFWNWFVINQQKFFNIIKSQGDIQRDFFSHLAPKLNELREGFWFLTGMFDDNTAELIITADGSIKNIVFIEELIAASPDLPNWKFTALKPPSENNQYSLKLEEYTFDESTMYFYPTLHQYMPDEIDITIVHKNMNDDNAKTISNGVYISLDNTLGELNAITSIDNLVITGPSNARDELIPIEKLKDYLNWRKKEFVEKYQDVRYDASGDTFTGIEAKLKSGNPLLAMINMDLLRWGGKASHPWIAVVEMSYLAHANGLPDADTYKLLMDAEDSILDELKSEDGYLHIGCESAEGIREVYFACHEFRKPSQVIDKIKNQYNGVVEIDFEIYKDKYWQTFDRFRPTFK